MNILIIGEADFIGNHIAEHYVLDWLPKFNIKKNIEII